MILAGLVAPLPPVPWIAEKDHSRQEWRGRQDWDGNHLTLSNPQKNTEKYFIYTVT